MKTSKLTAFAAAVAATLLLNASRSSAQDSPPPPPPPAAPVASPSAAPGATSGTSAAPGGRAQWGDRQHFHQQMMDGLKAGLKASDEEWSVIQPLLEKAQAKQREAGRSPFGGGRRGPGGPGGFGGPGPGPGPEAAPGGERPPRPDFGRTPETADLQKALADEGTAPEAIKAKLEAVREARKKAEADYDQACQDLSKVLTQRQEASLVLIGILQ